MTKFMAEREGFSYMPIVMPILHIYFAVVPPWYRKKA